MRLPERDAALALKQMANERLVIGIFIRLSPRPAEPSAENSSSTRKTSGWGRMAQSRAYANSAELVGPKDLLALDAQELSYRFVRQNFSARLNFAAFRSVFARFHGRKPANDLR